MFLTRDLAAWSVWREHEKHWWCPPSMSNIFDYFKRGGDGEHLSVNMLFEESMKTTVLNQAIDYGKKPNGWCLDMERAWRLNVQTGSVSMCLTRDYLQNCIKQYMAKWCDYNDNNNKAPSLNHSVFSVCVCIFFVESKALGKRLRNVTLNWCCLTLWLQECLFLALPEAKCW